MKIRSVIIVPATHPLPIAALARHWGYDCWVVPAPEGQLMVSMRVEEPKLDWDISELLGPLPVEEPVVEPLVELADEPLDEPATPTDSISEIAADTAPAPTAEAVAARMSTVFEDYGTVLVSSRIVDDDGEELTGDVTAVRYLHGEIVEDIPAAILTVILDDNIEDLLIGQRTADTCPGAINASELSEELVGTVMKKVFNQ